MFDNDIIRTTEISEWFLWFRSEKKSWRISEESALIKSDRNVEKVNQIMYVSLHRVPEIYQEDGNEHRPLYSSF